MDSYFILYNNDTIAHFSPFGANFCSAGQNAKTDHNDRKTFHRLTTPAIFFEGSGAQPAVAPGVLLAASGE